VQEKNIELIVIGGAGIVIKSVGSDKANKKGCELIKGECGPNICRGSVAHYELMVNSE
jgi:hypothetical protein